jgi:hypothetical protein
MMLCLACATLCGCGSSKIDVSGNKNVTQAIDAATGPLQDLNIRKQEIPEILKVAAKNPYARPEKAKCTTVREELAKLDEVLGEDMKAQDIELASADGSDSEFLNVDKVKVPTREQIGDGAMGMVRSRVLGAIRSQTDILPFRSIVRTITGADRHQKKLTEAYEAGKIRRAYLKGFAQERFGERCLAPPVVVEAKVDATVATQ